MTPADISVVIPTINEAAVVAKAVLSLGKRARAEVIVVDGGSEDADHRCGDTSRCQQDRSFASGTRHPVELRCLDGGT